MEISQRIWNYLQFILLLQYFANCNYMADAPEIEIQNQMHKEPSLKTMYIVDYIKHYNYPVETHYITTADGYILKLFRLQAKNQPIVAGKPVVLMQPGLLDSSDDFVVNEEHLAPGFIMANKGFDVWLGNNRGNKHCLEHRSMSQHDKRFWNFSWQNMSEYDMPAIFLYIYQLTNQKVNYMGHSQGNTIIGAAVSENNQIIKRTIGKCVFLAPVFQLIYSKSLFVKTIKNIHLFKMAQDLGFKSFVLLNDFEQKTESNICATLKFICTGILSMFASSNTELDNKSRWPIIFGHYPGGTSIMTLVHWEQMSRIKDRFKLLKYDYGKSGNLLQYGQSNPPSYDLSKIDIPIYIFSGSNDTLADLKDTMDFKSILDKGDCPHSEIHVVDHFDHGTFLWSKDMSYLDKVEQIMRSP